MEAMERIFSVIDTNFLPSLLQLELSLEEEHFSILERRSTSYLLSLMIPYSKDISEATYSFLKTGI